MSAGINRNLAVREEAMKRILVFCLVVVFCLASNAWAADTFANSARVTDRHRVDHAPELWHSYDTGSGAMAETLAAGEAFELKEVRIHLNTASATVENLTITLDSGIGGTAYDSVPWTDGMNTVKDYSWIPDKELHFTATDELDFAWANSDSRTWGLEVIWKKTNK